ncbi:MAG: hypothetical protein ABIG44_16030 [Planctomycetota bacterium]
MWSAEQIPCSSQRIAVVHGVDHDSLPQAIHAIRDLGLRDAVHSDLEPREGRVTLPGCKAGWGYLSLASVPYPSTSDEILARVNERVEPLVWGRCWFTSALNPGHLSWSSAPDDEKLRRLVEMAAALREHYGGDVFIVPSPSPFAFCFQGLTCRRWHILNRFDKDVELPLPAGQAGSVVLASPGNCRRDAFICVYDKQAESIAWRSTFGFCSSARGVPE